MQWTISVPLHPRTLRGLKPKQAQHLLHRDLSANSGEVDTGHGCSSLSDDAVPGSRTVPLPHAPFGNENAAPRVVKGRRRSGLEDRSVASRALGNGNGPPGAISQRAANPRACGRAGRLVPATPAPRPGARSGPPANRGASLASAPRPGPEGRGLDPPD